MRDARYSTMPTSKLHPIIQPAEEYEHPQSPVRVNAALGATEDLDRDLDGFPHLGFAGLIGGSFVFAVALLFLWSRGDRYLAVTVVLAAPVLAITLSRWAASKRDRIHPSR